MNEIVQNIPVERHETFGPEMISQVHKARTQFEPSLSRTVEG